MELLVTILTGNVNALQAGMGLIVPFFVKMERLVLSVLSLVLVRTMLHATMSVVTAAVHQATLQLIVLKVSFL